MKILIIGSVYPRYDEDNEVPWLRESIKRLKAENIEIQVLAPSWKGLKSHTIDDVKVNRFRYATSSLEILTHDEGAPSKINNKPWMQLLAIIYVISGFIKGFNLCQKNNFDLLHVHWPFPHCLFAIPLKWIFKTPMVINYHGASLMLAQKKTWIKPFQKFFTKQADQILCNSSFTKSMITDLNPKANIIISPYGTTLPALKSKNNNSTNKFKLLFVGRHIERKGIIYLIKAMSLLDENYELNIVGEGDLTEDLKIEASAIMQDTSANIIFPGKVSSEELSNLYNQSDVFILPAIVDSKGDTEGLGVVLVEAINFGLAVIASNVGGIPDVINQNTGILINEKSPKDIAKAIVELKNNPKKLQTLVTNAQNHIRKYFSWDIIISKQIKMYHQIIEQNSTK